MVTKISQTAVFFILFIQDKICSPAVSDANVTDFIQSKHCVQMYLLFSNQQEPLTSISSIPNQIISKRVKSDTLAQINICPCNCFSKFA